MPKTAYLWCPAYPLSDEPQRLRTVAIAQELADRTGMRLVQSLLLGRYTGPGAWLDRSLRLDDLVRGMDHDVLIAARGGYGCLDLVEAMLAWPRTRAPQLIGYSDVTVLHALWRRRGWGETLYGFMPGVESGPRALSSTASLLAGEGLVLDQLAAPEGQVLRSGSASGALFPACLRVLAGLVGTPAMPDLNGCLLAIEDLDERPYRIDRDLQQLARSGCLRGVMGLICGGFPAECPANYLGPSAAEICRRWAEILKLPAVFALPFGHHADPLTLPCGRIAALDCETGGWSLRLGPSG